MLYIKFLLLSLFATTLGFGGEEVAKKQEVVSVSEEEFPQVGVLCSENGFVYLDVSDNYIHKLISLIEDEGFEKPPYFEDGKNIGAHISVISPKEMEKYGVGKIEEVGRKFFFLIKDYEVVRPLKGKGIESVCIIAVDAPDLDALREKQGLPKIKDYYITIGIKYKGI